MKLVIDIPKRKFNLIKRYVSKSEVVLAVYYYIAIGKEYKNRWIPVSERLPKEGINPVTKDYYGYPVTFKNNNVVDIRFYKFGEGHWWNGPEMVDKNVIAWWELPKPYKGGVKRRSKYDRWKMDAEDPESEGCR